MTADTTFWVMYCSQDTCMPHPGFLHDITHSALRAFSATRGDCTQVAGVSTVASATVSGPSFVSLHPTGAQLDYSSGGTVVSGIVQAAGDLAVSAVFRSNATLLSMSV